MFTAAVALSVFASYGSELGGAMLFGTAFAAPAICVMTAFLFGLVTGRTRILTFLFGFLFAGAFAVAGFAVLLGATYEATGSIFNLNTLGDADADPDRAADRDGVLCHEGADRAGSQGHG